MKNLMTFTLLALTTFTLTQPAHAWGDKRHFTQGSRCETATHFRATVREAGNPLGQVFAMVKGSGAIKPLFKSETAESYQIGEATLLRTIQIHPTHTDEIFTLEIDNDYDNHFVAQMSESDDFVNLASARVAKVLGWLQEALPYRPQFPDFVPPLMPWVLNENYPKPSKHDLVCPDSINSRQCFIKLGYLKREHDGCY